MRLHQKLLLGFALVALLMSGVGYVAQTMNARIAAGVRVLSDHALRELEAIHEMTVALQATQQAARALVHGGDEVTAESLENALDRFERLLTASRSAATADRAQAEQQGQPERSARAQQTLQRLEDLHEGFRIYRLQIIELARVASTRPDRAQQIVEGALEPLYWNALHRPLAHHQATVRAAVEEAADAIQAQRVQADQFLFVAVLLAIGFTLVLGISIAHTISSPLLVLEEATRSLGRGRLDRRVRITTRDEVGDLGTAFNEMAEGLSRTTVSRHYLHNILHSMADPLLVTDEAGTVQLANRALLDALGYDRETVVGAPLAKLFWQAEAAADRVLVEVQRWGFTGNLELGFVTKEGAVLPVSFSAALMRGEEGEVQGVVCVAKDATEQKLFERELVRARERAEEARGHAERAREAAEAMSRMKSNFLANMSHEIRTPLTGIIGSAQVLATEQDGEARELGEIIERAGVRLLDTINSVLDMARIEAGEFHLFLEPLSLSEEVADAVAVLRRIASGSGLALEVVKPEEPVWALADHGCLHRILNNLIGNALKFTEHGGVTVEIEAVEQTVFLRVRDTGVGIAEAFLPHLFDDFKQESSGLKRRHEGSGLGLAITKKLVEMLDGEIAVESVKGVGSTFTVRLPRASGGTTPQTPAAGIASGTAA